MRAEGKSRVVVDTSACIDALREDGDAEIRTRVRDVVLDGSAVFCDMVLLEPWNGARGNSEIALLRELQREISSVDTGPEVWNRARQLAGDCRKRGITVPATDLLVASCAEFQGCEVLHDDANFERIQQVQRSRNSSL